MVEGSTAARAVAVEAAVALDDQAIRRAHDLIRDQEVVADPAVVASVVVALAIALATGGSTDEQRECQQCDGQGEAYQASKRSLAHVDPPS